MTIDQARAHSRLSGAVPKGQAGAGVGGAGSQEPAESSNRIRAWLVGCAGGLAVLAAVALALRPYERGLVGYLDGERQIVRTSCGAPLTAAFSERTGNLLLDDRTWADGPPCQRSAAFRLGLAGLIGVTGVLALADAWRRSRSAPRRPFRAGPRDSEREGSRPAKDVGPGAPVLVPVPASSTSNRRIRPRS